MITGDFLVATCSLMSKMPTTSLEHYPFISIIIPTYNRANTLALTLESFVNQNYDKAKYELIIADNNSSDNTKQLTEEWQENQLCQIKYLFEPRQGVHYARNAAFKCSKVKLYITQTMT